MMTNLFSSFDPATSNSISMNWISTMTFIALMPPMYWMTPNQGQVMLNSMTKIMSNEFKILIGPTYLSTLIIMTSMFIFIMTNNLLGLLPYTFTSSSHIVFTMSLALPLWVALMMFGWINNTKNMLAHLIPTGTPMPLMPFMVCIETISNIIRPGSLAVRLTANMIAGHLLMTLLGNSATIMNYTSLMVFSAQIILMWFETAVSVIQAYVFSVLSTLYSSEVI
uniref:ATP synthase subunit a n=1 Tax=Libiocoris heissi TaxID=1176477 RepID=A0A172DYW8_9HEMI|nr:ATP synthase F0 subunit 6 [Libiocoris heissi]AFI54719.1 ATP synthase F0 subunit 6 [Libiocoris heissi]